MPALDSEFNYEEFKKNYRFPIGVIGAERCAFKLKHEKLSSIFIIKVHFPSNTNILTIA